MFPRSVHKRICLLVVVAGICITTTYPAIGTESAGIEARSDDAEIEQLSRHRQVDRLRQAWTASDSVRPQSSPWFSGTGMVQFSRRHGRGGHSRQSDRDASECVRVYIEST